LITKTVDDLSKSDQVCHNSDELIETPNAINTQESYLQEKTMISAYELLKMEQEAEILREQVESLKQELQYAYQLVEEYRQELLDANDEMSLLNRELQDTFSLERLKLDQAKRLAQNLLISRQFTSESFAKLLSAISGVVVTADELEPTNSQYKDAA
jgi:cell fate (sporulation/competence/biofilm development) regulator YmcA (YheA/YmcA/DUF963 family)